jgi:hypothetical protein
MLSLLLDALPLDYTDFSFRLLVFRGLHFLNDGNFLFVHLLFLFLLLLVLEFLQAEWESVNDVEAHIKNGSE